MLLQTELLKHHNPEISFFLSFMALSHKSLIKLCGILGVSFKGLARFSLSDGAGKEMLPALQVLQQPPPTSQA